MKKIVLLFVFGSLFLAGCPKHEIIPAPEPKVDLEANFIGKINGTDVEYTQNVEGFYLDATKTKIILPSPNPSSAVYSSDIKTSQGMTSMKISMGSILFDGGASTDPTLSLFNNFFTSNLTPSYSAAAASGFEVTYRDATGAVWISDPAAANTVVFSNIKQESDASGDYSKFVCNFSCTLTRTVGPDTFTLPITDAVFTGWFKR